MENPEISLSKKRGMSAFVLRVYLKEKERFLWHQETALDLMFMERGKFKIFLFSARGRDITLRFKITANQCHTIKLPCTAQKIKGWTPQSVRLEDRFVSRQCKWWSLVFRLIPIFTWYVTRVLGLLSCSCLSWFQIGVESWRLWTGKISDFLGALWSLGGFENLRGRLGGEGQLAFWEQGLQMPSVLWHIGPTCAVENCPMILECPGGREGETRV